MRLNKLYIILLTVMFLTFVIVFNTFPRSTYSELEKRDLATFPELTWEKLKSGDFTAEVSSWFSDSEPYRDEFMRLSMEVDNRMRLALSDDNVTFHAPTAPIEIEEDEDVMYDDTLMADTLTSDTSYVDAPPANENAKIANAGIIIIGSGEKLRALMLYHGTERMGAAFANVANVYKETFGAGVRVYSMAIPTAAEFYCPEKVMRSAKRQRPTLDNILSKLSPDVTPVDVYSVLSQHTAEDIYLRTDHHWAPLGAYYAAQEFARVAGVPFPDLSAYERKVTQRFVGSMYGYSNDIAVKEAPEDFIYYVPNAVEYTTTYVDFKVSKEYRVVGEGRPYQGRFFMHHRDGSGTAYSTFMGGDYKLTQVKTGTKNGRRVMIIKDSFGNAIPGYLFYSFEEVHVVDFRYFTKNMTAYVNAHGITDILFAFNMFNACSSSASKKPLRYLTQKGGVELPPVEEKADTVVSVTDTVRVDTVKTEVVTDSVVPVPTVVEPQPVDSVADDTMGLAATPVE